MAKTKIEWTEHSWNPVRARRPENGALGWHCEHVSPGCEHCYAESINLRLGTRIPFKPGHRREIEIFTTRALIEQPLRWQKPRMVFVCSMTDLFADFVPEAMIDDVFRIMLKAKRHTFQILTKRPTRMRAYMAKFKPDGQGWITPQGDSAYASQIVISDQNWPPQNIWFGTSVEDQRRADERIPDLMMTPAAIRFLSCEPLLGPIDLHSIPWSAVKPSPYYDLAYCGGPGLFGPDSRRINNDHLDWIICGAESGNGARPMDIAWARSIRDQCQDSGTAFFLKQFATTSGKKIATPELDGTRWTQMPGARVQEKELV